MFLGSFKIKWIIWLSIIFFIIKFLAFNSKGKMQVHFWYVSLKSFLMVYWGQKFWPHLLFELLYQKFGITIPKVFFTWDCLRLPSLYFFTFVQVCLIPWHFLDPLPFSFLKFVTNQKIGSQHKGNIEELEVYHLPIIGVSLRTNPKV